MPRTGRPKLAISQDLFEDLCQIQCTKAEIVGVLRISEDTLERWIKRTYGGRTFAAVFEEKRAGGFVSLRRSQFVMAQTNPTMSIWLGKQYLRQRDEIHNYNIDLTAATDEQIDRIAAGEDPQVVMATPSSGGTGTETPLTSDSIN